VGRKRLVIGALGLFAIAAGCGTSQPPLSGVALDRALPNVRLIDERGRATSMRAFRGTVVVLAPTLTLCHEHCPMTSGALTQIQYDARRAGLADRVTVLEVSVDPWRDTPARLRAYRRDTGVRFRLLTGTHAELTRFWRFFGVGFYPTGHGRTFDVAHTDGVFFVDERGHWRIAVIGLPNVHGQLAERLKRRLKPAGLRALAHPRAGWTVQQALEDLGRLLGHRIPAAPLP
jgi:cytochrome oxidase Cu insertion factor (SCO1/SenC/PrrC family)